MKTEFNASLLPHNTFGINAKAKAIVTYDSVEELLKLLPQLREEKKYLNIGAGSNLLFMGDYDGTILHSAIHDLDIVSETSRDIKVKVGAGWIMDVFIEECINRGWYGLENLSLIPGEVGSSAVQNVGAYGVEAGDLISSVYTVSVEDGSKRIFTPEECHFTYRHSTFKNPEMRGKYIITHVEYHLQKVFTPKLEYGGVRKSLEQKDENYEQKLTAQMLRDTIIEIRREKLPDPAVTGNAGSFFVNPIVSRNVFEELLNKYPQMPHYEVDDEHVKIPAGWMIDQCGWKGKALGKAGVHNRQALVLINCGGATGQDVVNLCDAIRNDVKERFGININPEVNFIS